MRKNYLLSEAVNFKIIRMNTISDRFLFARPLDLALQTGTTVNFERYL